MRALQVQELVGPSGVAVADVPEPEGGDGMVVVDVRAGGVSFVDLLLSQGRYQMRPDPPFTLGLQLAGTTPDGARMAAVTFGAFAERVAVPELGTLPLPDEASFEEGAALVMNYQTAHFGLKRRGRLRAGETVLVHGAGGGAGSAAVQVAKALGARVIAVASDEAKREAARSAGADEAIDAGEGWRERVKGLTGGDGVDVVFDPVGGDRMTDSLRTLAPEGRLLVVGFAGGAIPDFAANRLLLRNVDVVGVNWGGLAMARPDIVAEAAQDLLRWHADGHVRPVIGARFPLERGGDALRAIEERRAVGNLVLTL
ncbi:MAG TPA: NADPH:quinone oxidoreductase family protein [Solirubrobacteraceae bacterium]|nr:NADPH:quinone oxidoreductase family protein [Solirubrobacteraceae bacterium]